MNENIPSEVTKKILETFNQAGSTNINTLQQVRDVQVVMGSLLQHETKRLEKKLGKDNLRVQQAKASLKRNQTIARDLEVELEIAKIRVPEALGWVERINMFRKTDQFRGRPKPNTISFSPSFLGNKRQPSLQLPM